MLPVNYIIYVQYVLIILLFIIWATKSPEAMEGFTQDKSFVLKQNDEIYDTFYMQVYDKLYIPSNNVKTISNTIVKYRYSKSDAILNISNTADQANSLTTHFDNIYIIHTSLDAVNYMQTKFPKLRNHIKQDDIMQPMTYDDNAITFIIITQFSVYKYPDSSRLTLFQNLDKWLVDHGLLFIELVEPHQFDTILPAASAYIDLEKHTTQRILENEVDFQSFSYNNTFLFSENTLRLTETFVDKKSRFVRKNEQIFYMLSIQEMLTEFLNYGFIVKDRIIIKEGSKYIYVLKKKNSRSN